MKKVTLSDLKYKANKKIFASSGSIFLLILIVLGIPALATYFINANKLFENAKLLELLYYFLIFIFTPCFSLSITFALYQIYNTTSFNVFSIPIIAFRYFIFSWKLVFRFILNTIFETLLLVVSYILFIKTSAPIIFSSILYIVDNPISTSNKFMFYITFICFLISLALYIIKSYYFSFASYIWFDNPDISAKAALLKSKKMMLGGNRLKLFLLRLLFSFNIILEIILYKLCYKFVFPLFLSDIESMIIALLISFGIIIIRAVYYTWLSYYIKFADIAFYKHLRDSEKKQQEKQTLNISDQYGMLEKAELKQNEKIVISNTTPDLDSFDTIDKSSNVPEYLESTYDSVHETETFDTFDTIYNLEKKDEE